MKDLKYICYYVTKLLLFATALPIRGSFIFSWCSDIIVFTFCYFISSSSFCSRKYIMHPAMLLRSQSENVYQTLLFICCTLCGIIGCTIAVFWFFFYIILWISFNCSCLIFYVPLLFILYYVPLTMHFVDLHSR